MKNNFFIWPPMLKVWHWIALTAVLLGLVFPACTGLRTAERGPASKREPDIRVLITRGKASIEITSSGPVRITGAGGFQLLHTNNAGRIIVTAREAALDFRLEPEGTVATSEGEAFIFPGKEAMLSIEDVSYPGRIKVYPESGGVSVVNVLALETYLEGVLPHEMGNPGPHGFAALEAQAIAARTYAFDKIKSNWNKPFDIHANIMDQIYRGTEGAFRLSTGAVRETRGQVLKYQGESVRAYYCASCGGHTSDIRRAWPEREPAPYLTGIRDVDPVTKETSCRNGRYFRWRYSFSGRRLGEILHETLPRELGISEEEIGALRDIRILERSPSGRIIILEIETTKGIFRIQGDRIRWVLMVDPEKRIILPSTLFDINKSMEGETVSFVSIIGGGNGHGVGMCQSGAIGMAMRGHTYQMILSHFYPGCRIIKEY